MKTLETRAGFSLVEIPLSDGSKVYDIFYGEVQIASPDSKASAFACFDAMVKAKELARG